ncbi:hypothetical protein Fot_11700 [Forsythia ovata]|uniref:Uncharacterized protein n=1 Tax=Forsythia ovata TaxID=205694 RepID=A0ABD1WKE8_9LAMI
MKNQHKEKTKNANVLYFKTGNWKIGDSMRKKGRRRTRKKKEDMKLGKMVGRKSVGSTMIGRKRRQCPDDALYYIREGCHLGRPKRCREGKEKKIGDTERAEMASFRSPFLMNSARWIVTFNIV